jgi:hypothetical protein
MWGVVCVRNLARIVKLAKSPPNYAPEKAPTFVHICA